MQTRLIGIGLLAAIVAGAGWTPEQEPPGGHSSGQVEPQAVPTAASPAPQPEPVIRGPSEAGTPIVTDTSGAAPDGLVASPMLRRIEPVGEAAATTITGDSPGPRAALGTAWSYQGQLKLNGVPVTGAYDMQFTLLDDASATVAGPICRDDVQVTAGLFTVELDFSPDLPFATSENRHLRIEVRPDATPANCSAGAYTTLSPPQELTATPYALGLRLPYFTVGQTSSSGENLFWLTNLSSGAAQVGFVVQKNIHPSGYGGLPNGGAAILANDASGSGTGTGTGTGVWGGGTSVGVWGQTINGAGTDSYGGFFRASHGTNRIGTYGTTEAGGFGVGRVIDSGVSGYSASGQGVSGVSSTGRGVYGRATATTGATYGVHGVSDSLTGRGVYGVAASTDLSSTAAGVYGEALVPGAYGGYFVGRGYFSQNVGIGQSVPAEELVIESNDAATRIDLNNLAANGDPQIRLRLNGTTAFSIGVDDSDGDKFKIGTTLPETNTRLAIDGSGNVGIGTTTPVSRLQVASADQWSWSLGNGWGDFNIGNGTYGLAMGVALGGGGAGTVRIWPMGDAGGESLVFGNPVAGDVLSVNANGVVGLDQSNLNNGNLTTPALVFGSGSGEGIASKRTATGNQFGLDFYTNFANRM